MRRLLGVSATASSTCWDWLRSRLDGMTSETKRKMKGIKTVFDSLFVVSSLLFGNFSAHSLRSW